MLTIDYISTFKPQNLAPLGKLIIVLNDTSDQQMPQCNAQVQGNNPYLEDLKKISGPPQVRLWLAG